MKKSRYTDSQILAILKQAEAGTAVPSLCREHGMSSATFYPPGPRGGPGMRAAPCAVSPSSFPESRVTRVLANNCRFANHEHRHRTL